MHIVAESFLQHITNASMKRNAGFLSNVQLVLRDLRLNVYKITPNGAKINFRKKNLHKTCVRKVRTIIKGEINIYVKRNKCKYNDFVKQCKVVMKY